MGSAALWGCTAEKVVSLAWHLQGHKMSAIVSIPPLTNVCLLDKTPLELKRETWELQTRRVILSDSGRGREKPSVT